MNIDERNENTGAYAGFRSTLHIGMGVVYLVLGGIAISLKYFGKAVLDPAMAYVIGGLMIVYGVFRIWRGIQQLRMKHRK